MLLDVLRPALRGLRRAPLISATIVATLGCCIGVNMVAFAVADQVFWRALPFDQPDRLALLTSISGSGGERRQHTAHDGLTWEAIAEHASTLEVAAYSPWAQGVNLAAGEQPAFVEVQRVSSRFFDTLHVAPAIGRGFTPEEDQRGGPSVVILSHALREKLFGADEVLGRPITLKGEPHTVIGVMPAGFRGLTEVDAWTPLRASASGEGGGTNYGILVRLPQGLAWSDGVATVRRIGETLPADEAAAANRAELGLLGLREGLTQSVRRPLTILLAAAFAVLLVGCLNVAALVLIQFRQRSVEHATYMALGASRWALARLLATEQIALAVLGGGLGIGVGAAGVRYLQRSTGGPADLLRDAQIDGRFLLVACGLTLLSLLLITAGPIWRAGRSDLRTVMADQTTGVTPRMAGSPARRWILVGEVAVAFALLIGAGLLLRTFDHLSSLSPGFDPEHVFAATVSLDDERYQDGEQIDRLFRSSLAALRADPAVESAAVGLGVPYERWLNLDVQRLDRPEKRELSDLIYITPGYFEALGIPLLAGRRFTETDDRDAEPVVIVSQAFVEQYFRDADALGTTIAVSGNRRRIVGVVGDVQRVPGWGDGAPLAAMPAAFVPAAQQSERFLALVHSWFPTHWVVRMQHPSGDELVKIRQAIESVDAQLPVGELRSLEAASSRALGWQRFQATLVGIFAALALFLAVIGLHGLIAQSVLERRRELGIRLALGATKGTALVEIARPAFVSVALGIALGFGITRLSNQWLRHQLWGIAADDRSTWLAVAAIFLIVVVGAAAVSGLRVARLQPTVILRDSR